MKEDLESLVQRAKRGQLGPVLDAHLVSSSMEGYRQAAVLALFTPTLTSVSGVDQPPRARAGGPEGLDLFFVQRSPHLAYHPGQIAFPGGGIDPGETPEGAAVREAEEEAGISAAQIDVLGTLGRVAVPISGNVVTVVLGWADTVIQTEHWDKAEVLHPLRVPVAGLLDARNRAQVDFYSHSSTGFAVASGWIWGFTGNLLDYLFTELGWNRPWDHSMRHRLTPAEAHGEAPGSADAVAPMS